MSIAPVSIPSPYNVFLYFLGGQKHEDSKLGVMINSISTIINSISTISTINKFLFTSAFFVKFSEFS